MSKRTSRCGHYAVIADRAAVCGPHNPFRVRQDDSEDEAWLQARLNEVLLEEARKLETIQTARQQFRFHYKGGNSPVPAQSGHSISNSSMGKYVPRRSRRRLA